MIQADRISLVMATVGRSNEVATCIASLAAQTVRAFELIIVDQNTDDRLVEIVARARAQGLEINHLRFGTRSLSAARNHGLKHCRYAITGIPDDDCWYEPGVVEAVLARFAANPRADALVGRWVEGDEDAHHGSDVLLNACRRFRGGPTDSYCLFFRTAMLRELDGFDERLGVPLWFGAAEETDLVLRLLTAGHTMVRERRARIHHPRKSPEDFPNARTVFTRVRGYERATGALYLKHRVSPWVAARGLMAPILRAGLSVGRPKRLAAELAIVLGRLEGLARWWRIESRRDSATRRAW